jgi:hypothetical protein
MGLGVSAWSKLVAAPGVASRVEYDHPDGYVEFRDELEWTEQNWWGRTGGLKPGVYTYATHYNFGVGYSWYGGWREWLCRSAGHGDPQRVWDEEVLQGPFIELINFADNQGVIAGPVAVKLAKDFAEHEAKIIAAAPKDSGYAEAYGQWWKAFELAADGGAVRYA